MAILDGPWHKNNFTWETMFLELSNIKSVEYKKTLPKFNSERWATASEGEIQVLIDKIRTNSLEG